MIPAVLLSRSRAFLFVAEAARSRAFLSRAGADFNNFDFLLPLMLSRQNSKIFRAESRGRSQSRRDFNSQEPLE